jgi:hypothetical protein
MLLLLHLPPEGLRQRPTVCTDAFQRCRDLVWLRASEAVERLPRVPHDGYGETPHSRAFDERKVQWIGIKDLIHDERSRRRAHEALHLHSDFVGGENVT